MNYLGGKSAIASQIARVIHSREGSFRHYVEPFLGGGSCFAAIAPYFASASAGDAHPDLIEMWKAAASGEWMPPNIVSREEYYRLKDAPISPERGFAGFGCSFAGKWFGGYAWCNDESREFAEENARVINRRAATMSSTLLLCTTYDRWDIGMDHVVYADPPYADTTGYGRTNLAGFDWNPEKFWEKMKEWSLKGAHVYVSEFKAPAGWKCVWKKVRANRFSNFHKSNVDIQRMTHTEKLYVYDGAGGLE